MKSDLFGFDVFKGNSLLTFQSNLNIPTPAGYILGSGDKLFIDIYGQSEAYYQIEINPEGTIILENFGPIHLSGLTVENATKRIENRLSRVYLGINGDKKNTFVNVSVGKSRTIKVNIVGEVAVPGSYTLSAFNSVYNALYAAGGITENATLRDIKVYRNNKLISKVDIYKYYRYAYNQMRIPYQEKDFFSLLEESGYSSLIESITPLYFLRSSVFTPASFSASLLSIASTAKSLPAPSVANHRSKVLIPGQAFGAGRS